jgi:hypothetical protein
MDWWVGRAFGIVMDWSPQRKQGQRGLPLLANIMQLLAYALSIAGPFTVLLI